MSNHTLPDSAVAVNNSNHSKAQVLLALEQLLEQCDDGDVPELINQIKTKLARRNYALNAHQCRLLDLSPELLERIGKFVLKSQGGSPTKDNFTDDIFPLLQTSSQLRTQLDTLRSTPLTYYIETDNPWKDVREDVKEWREKGFHKGPTTIVVTTMSRYLKPSTTAALAGALECAIFGGLSDPPAVYIKLKTRIGTTRREQYRNFYVSHLRAEGMLMTSGGRELVVDSSSRLSPEKGKEIWEQAKRKTGDEAP